EHALALPVRVAVQRLHAVLILQQALSRRWHGPAPGKAPRLVEHARSFLAAHAIGSAQQQAGAENVRIVAFAATRDEGIAFLQQGPCVVHPGIVRYFTHVYSEAKVFQVCASVSASHSSAATSRPTVATASVLPFFL